MPFPIPFPNNPQNPGENWFSWACALYTLACLSHNWIYGLTMNIRVVITALSSSSRVLPVVTFGYICWLFEKTLNFSPFPSVTFNLQFGPIQNLLKRETCIKWPIHHKKYSPKVMVVGIFRVQKWNCGFPNPHTDASCSYGAHRWFAMGSQFWVYRAPSFVKTPFIQGVRLFLCGPRKAALYICLAEGFWEKVKCKHGF